MIPALIPGTLETGTRRRVPKASQNRKVPLWTPEPEGQLFQGVIRVPLRLCHTPEHTNARLEFDKLITENLQRWAEWRKRRGWFIQGTPRVNGPYDPPEGSDKDKARYARATSQIGRVGSAEEVTSHDHGEEVKWYMAEARFTREEPVYVKLEDHLFMRHLALAYGVDPDRDPGLTNNLPEAKDYIDVEGGIDPMQEAEESRQARGLKRSDYLMGKVWEPL